MSRKALTFTMTLSVPTLSDPVTVARRVGAALWRTAMVWQRRAEDRRHLREMPVFLRRDIGLTAEQCRDEARKPFWMA